MFRKLYKLVIVLCKNLLPAMVLALRALQLRDVGRQRLHFAVFFVLLSSAKIDEHITLGVYGDVRVNVSMSR